MLTKILSDFGIIAKKPKNEYRSPIIYSKDGLTIRVYSDGDVSIEVDNKHLSPSHREILGMRIEHSFNPLRLTVINTRISNTDYHTEPGIHIPCKCMTITSKEK